VDARRPPRKLLGYAARDRVALLLVYALGS
jgi:hypothetical protein